MTRTRAPKANTPIKMARKRVKLTQVEVAERVGMSYRHYQDIEDWRVIPGVLLAFRIADVLGTTERGLWEPLLEAQESVAPVSGGSTEATEEG